MKTAKTAQTYATSSTFHEEPTSHKELTSYEVRIPGLRHIADDLFILEDMPQPVEIDWPSVARATGFGDRPMPDALCDDIADAIWRYAIAEALAARIRR